MAKQKIDDFLNVEPSDCSIVEYQAARKIKKNSEKPTEQDFVDDFNFARGTLHDIIETGSIALQGAMKVATDSQHPRAFEVASTLLGQVSSAAKDLLSLTETATKITPQKPKEEENKTDQISMSTDALNKLLSDKST